jgi:hypothetical protein
MILTPLDSARLPAALDRFAASLCCEDARRVFKRIARIENAERASGALAALHHEAALDFAASFGITTMSGAPEAGFSWDGQRLRSDTEAYVLIHEVAHFQLASPARRRVVDFGLGAGPDTGERASADAAMCVFGLARETEEAMASLLGVLWEVELGQPGLASFLDHNWLEGAGRPSTAAYFAAMVGRLRAGGFLDAQLHPTRRLRSEPDDAE